MDTTGLSQNTLCSTSEHEIWRNRIESALAKLRRFDTLTDVQLERAEGHQEASGNPPRR